MITTVGNDIYYEWVREEARIIKSDGCTRVIDIRLPCCHEHDLGYHHGRDVRDAYRRFRQGYPKPWEAAKRTTRNAVDNTFWSCNVSFSKVGWASPVANIRRVGVLLGGWISWRRHRKQRP